MAIIGFILRGRFFRKNDLPIIVEQLTDWSEMFPKFVRFKKINK
jgi:hypothetical protein